MKEKIKTEKYIKNQMFEDCKRLASDKRQLKNILEEKDLEIEKQNKCMEHRDEAINKMEKRLIEYERGEDGYIP